MRRRAAVGAVGLAALAFAAAFAFWTQPREVAYVIPPGTAARLAAGETVNVLPATIVLRAGDTLSVTNQDTAAVQVGPFPVQPGQRFSHQYRTTGVYELACTVHPEGKLRVVVR